MERRIILSHLLDKYERSKHLSQPGVSSRRVMLRIDRGELAEYTYEMATVRDRFNQAAQALEHEKLVQLEWVDGRPIVKAIILNLDLIDNAYLAAHRAHPAQTVTGLCALIREALSDVRTEWICQWRDSVCRGMEETLSPLALYARGIAYTQEFLRVLSYYDKLDAVVTTRAFSSGCLQNSKRFEQEFQDEFLRAASRYDAQLVDACAQKKLGAREKLAVLGILKHPELYQLSGKCSLIMNSGSIDMTSLFPHGLALPSSAVDDLSALGYHSVQRVLFIENLTNYDEYLRTEVASDELVIYHGGFFSPQKRRLIQKIASCTPTHIEVCFWADIDLGGFQMFMRLQELFPQLCPMRMSANDVSYYAPFGLARDKVYLHRLRNSLENNEFPLFKGAIEAILQHGVTIEQEVFYVQPAHL